MSEDVFSKGLMAVILEDGAVSDVWFEEVVGNKNLHLSYDGRIVYSRHDDYGYGLNLETTPRINDVEEFIKDCTESGVNIDAVSVRSYSCRWYNGSDSDMSEMTYGEYMKRITD